MMLDVREIQRFITLGKNFTCRSGEVLVEKEVEKVSAV